MANNSQHCWMLHAACVACCTNFETAQTFQPTTPIIFLLFHDHPRIVQCSMLDQFAQLFQHCWGHARTSHMVSLEFTKSYRLYPFHNDVYSSSQHCCELMHGICLHTTANTEATTLNIFDATMLGVVCQLTCSLSPVAE